MKAPIQITPAPFKALVGWLERNFGLMLRGRINFTRGFYVDGIEVTAERLKQLYALVDADTDTKTARNPRNKHPAKSRDAPEPDLID